MATSNDDEIIARELALDEIAAAIQTERERCARLVNALLKTDGRRFLLACIRDGSDPAVIEENARKREERKAREIEELM